MEPVDVVSLYGSLMDSASSGISQSVIQMGPLAQATETAWLACIVLLAALITLHLALTLLPSFAERAEAAHRQRVWKRICAASRSSTRRDARWSGVQHGR